MPMSVIQGIFGQQVLGDFECCLTLPDDVQVVEFGREVLDTSRMCVYYWTHHFSLPPYLQIAFYFIIQCCTPFDVAINGCL